MIRSSAMLYTPIASHHLAPSLWTEQHRAVSFKVLGLDLIHAARRVAGLYCIPQCWRL